MKATKASKLLEAEIEKVRAQATQKYAEYQYLDNVLTGLKSALLLLTTKEEKK